MKATPLSPAEIFGNQIRYVVPLFQRPYVWDEERQWAPLWEDVARVAESVLETPPSAFGPRMVSPHFLGAVVVEQQHAGVNYISVRGIVDGQQRMTTLQLLMDATQAVVAQHGDPQDAQALEVLVLNPAQLSPNKDERFKVWPTDRDQAAFRAAMDDEESVPPHEECLKPVDVKSRVEAPGGRTFPMSRQVPQARPACQRRSGRYARAHGSCSGRIGEVRG